MKLYRVPEGAIVQEGGRGCLLREADWDALFNRRDLGVFLTSALQDLRALPGGFDPDAADLLAPVGAQEVWGAGITYHRSRDARMEEARATGGDFYGRVYEAERPEVFFKATPHRVVGHRQKVRVRKDSRSTVPEPELALAVNSAGRIFGYTLCNDVTSRDIESENPLYLPQAKIYDQSCALGPGLLILDGPLPPRTEIRMEVLRHGKTKFEGSTPLTNLRRPPELLVEYLFRDNTFPQGCFLSTGTGVVPPASFTLEPGDEVRIRMDPIGTLLNGVM